MTAHSTEVTAGPWRRDGSQLHTGTGEETYQLVGDKDGEYPTVFISSYCRTEAEINQLNANVDLILAAINTCFTINPGNPLAVAEGIVPIIETADEVCKLRDLVHGQNAVEKITDYINAVEKLRALLSRIRSKK